MLLAGLFVLKLTSRGPSNWKRTLRSRSHRDSLGTNEMFRYLRKVSVSQAAAHGFSRTEGELTFRAVPTGRRAHAAQPKVVELWLRYEDTCPTAAWCFHFLQGNANNRGRLQISIALTYVALPRLGCNKAIIPKRTLCYSMSLVVFPHCRGRPGSFQTFNNKDTNLRWHTHTHTHTV